MSIDDYINEKYNFYYPEDKKNKEEPKVNFIKELFTEDVVFDKKEDNKDNSLDIDEYLYNKEKQLVDGVIDDIREEEKPIEQLVEPVKPIIDKKEPTTINSMDRFLEVDEYEEPKHEELPKASIMIGGGGENNTISNLGNGIGIYKDKIGSDLRIKSLSGSGNVNLYESNDIIFISATGGSFTDSTSAQNIGNGIGVFSGKSGDILQFNSLSGSGDVSVTQSGNILVVSADIPDVTYTNLTPTTTAIGGITAGSTFTSRTMSQMFDALLYPYQSPSFSTFTIQSQTTPIEVGSSISSNRTFTWSTTYSSNVASNSIIISDVTGGTTLATGLANDGSETVTMAAITKNTATTNQFRISAVNTQGTGFSTTYTVTWQWRRYYGESTTTPLTESDIEGLRVSGLVSTYAGTYTFSSGGYKYICYPSLLGTASSFKDSSTNLDVPFETVYTVSVTNSYGITTTYNVHRSTNIIGSSINIVVA